MFFLNVYVSLKASFEHLPLPSGFIFFFIYFFIISILWEKIWHLKFQTFTYPLVFFFWILLFLWSLCCVLYLYNGLFLPKEYKMANSFEQCHFPSEDFRSWQSYLLSLLCFFDVICGIKKKISLFYLSLTYLSTHCWSFILTYYMFNFHDVFLVYPFLFLRGIKFLFSLVY